MDTLTLPPPQHGLSHQKKRKREKSPLFQVVLHNDDENTFGHVMLVLEQVLGITLQQAFQYTLQAHETGQAIIFLGPLEEAERMKDRILGSAIDPDNESQTRLIATLQRA